MSYIRAGIRIGQLMKSILSVVPGCISPGAEQIKAPWRALPIEFVELSRNVSYGD
jgi:hypothetical protein